MTTKKENNEFYISNEEFFYETVNSHINGEMSDRLVELFMILCDRTVNHRYFVRYFHLRNDFVAIGRLACVHGFSKFRPFKDKERSIAWEKNKTPIEYNYMECNNCFSYFTTCIMNALFQFLKEEYNQSNIINSMREDEGLGASWGYTDMIREQEGDIRDYEEPSEVTTIIP